MKKLLLLLIIPFLSFGQDLTYVPDDCFENYLETFFPNSDNGFDNDNYVLSSGLQGFGEVIQLSPIYLDCPIFDLTGLEDVFGNIPAIQIHTQLITDLDLNELDLNVGGESGSCNLNIYDCSLLENLILPSDTIGLNIQMNPSLNSIMMPNDFVLSSFFLTQSTMCELIFKGSTNTDLSTLNIQIGQSYINQIDLSEFEIPYGTGFYFTLGGVDQINLIGPNLYNWTAFNFQTTSGSGCVQVENPDYCQVSNYWVLPSPSLSEYYFDTNCYNPIDCDSITTISEYNPKTFLIKKIDILGRETTNNKGFQLHIYNDGTVEKKYLIK